MKQLQMRREESFVIVSEKLMPNPGPKSSPPRFGDGGAVRILNLHVAAGCLFIG